MFTPTTFPCTAVFMSLHAEAMRLDFYEIPLVERTTGRPGFFRDKYGKDWPSYDLWQDGEIACTGTIEQLKKNVTRSCTLTFEEADGVEKFVAILEKQAAVYRAEKGLAS